jgi:hypothetical protein
MVGTLQLDEVRYRGMHRSLILTQGALCFARRACGVPQAPAKLLRVGSLGGTPCFFACKIFAIFRSKEEVTCHTSRLPGSKDEHRR